MNLRIKKLDLYIMKKFIGTFFLSLGLILCIVVIFDLSEKLEKFLEHEAPASKIMFGYYLNFIPYFASAFSALFTFVSVILFTSGMASKSEIIAILSSGISFRRLTYPYMATAGIIAVFSFALNAFIIPNANERRIAFEKEYMGKNYNNKDQFIHRQIAPGSYIYMSSFSAGARIGYDFSLENFRNDSLVYKLTSSRISWDKNKEKWTIYNWRIRTIENDVEVYKTGNKLDTLLGFAPEEFSENPKYIKDVLTLPELREYEERMRFRGSSNIMEFQLKRYQMWSDAFSTFILTFIGLCISSKRMRGGMGIHLGVGLVLGFSYILFMRFSTVFATNGALPPLLAVWIPNILYAIISIFTYRLAPK